MLTVSVCPLTMGAVTSMTDAGFNRSCRMRNKDQDIRNGYGSGVGTSTIYDEYCKQCGGEYPPELTIIKLEEIDMALKPIIGKCEVCGKDGGGVVPVDGKACCPVCQHIRRNVKKRGDLVLEQLREFHPELLSMPSDDDMGALAMELHKAKADCAGALNKVNGLQFDVQDLNDALKRDLAHSKTMEDELETLRPLAGINETLTSDYAAMEQIVNELRECNNDLQTERMEVLNKNLSLIQEIEQLKQATLWVPEEEALAISSDFGRYDALKDVLRAAITQAAIGKGKERHANDEPFEEQDICTITRSEGHGFTRGQAIKKIKEAKRLDRDAAIRELLGAINYLAADVIVLGEVA